MSFGSRIADKRKELGMTRQQLAAQLGVTPSAIGNYETDYSTPGIELIYKIFSVLHCDANYLYQDDMEQNGKQDDICPKDLQKLCSKYRFLDEHGKQAVDTILDIEFERCKDSFKPKRIYTYMHKIAAAGNGFYIDDIPMDTIEATEKPGADFIIGVNGDSMEPTYSDGDMVYVQRTSNINIGEVGIFIFCGECFIKEMSKDGLVSHNPKYELIKGDSDIRVIGRVLGKVEEE